LEGHNDPYAYQQDAVRDALAGASISPPEALAEDAPSEPHLASAHDPQVTPETTLAGAVGATDMRPAQDIYDDLGLVVQPLYPQSSQDATISSPSPQPDLPTDVDEALLPDIGPGPHHPHLKRFAELKTDYPEAVAFVRVDQAYESYAEDAQIAAYAVGRPTQPMQ